LIAWCAFDYASLHTGYNAVKCPGVVDTFRIPKLGASFYRAQVSPTRRPVIEPSFFWDFSPASGGGPGQHALIFSNCDRLVLSVGTHSPITVTPDKAGYPNLAYPPFFADLSIDGGQQPDLRIEGYVGDRLMLTRRFSSDRTHDTLVLRADDPEIAGDGIDATRVWLSVCDMYGAPSPCLEGQVAFLVEGPADRVGDATISFPDTGGVGAIWVRSKPHSSGRVTIHASHPRFGTKSVTVRVSATDRS
jgi:beta-galactosidase